MCGSHTTNYRLPALPLPGSETELAGKEGFETHQPVKKVMKTATIFLCILLAGAFCTRAFSQMNGGQYAVSQSSVSSGGGSINQGSYRIESIVGQFASSANLAADSYSLSSSFWSDLFPALAQQVTLTKSAPAKAYHYSNLNAQSQPVFSYTIVATNGYATSTDLTFEDVLPAGLNHVSTTIAPSGSCNIDFQNKVTCTNVLINPNESATITINVRPNGQVLNANLINTASITSVTPNIAASATVYIDDEGPSYQTVYQVLPGSCSPNVLFAGLDFDASGRAVVGWRESVNCGSNTYRWSRFENNSWGLRTITDYPGGIRGEPDLALAPDGTPFMAYAIRDAFIFGQDWYTAHIVNLALEPNGHGANVQPIEARQNCLTTNPKFAMDFAPNAVSPHFLLGTSCSFGGWLSLDNATIHGAPRSGQPQAQAESFTVLITLPVRLARTTSRTTRNAVVQIGEPTIQTVLLDTRYSSRCRIAIGLLKPVSRLGRTAASTWRLAEFRFATTLSKVDCSISLRWMALIGRGPLSMK
jgi:uncharacterized repeat protein (TIGR01451 family)